MSDARFRAVGRQGQQGEVVRDGECPGPVPAGTVEDEERMGTGSNGAGDLGQVGVHRRRVDEGQDQPCRGAARRRTLSSTMRRY